MFFTFRLLSTPRKMSCPPNRSAANSIGTALAAGIDREAMDAYALESHRLEFEAFFLCFNPIGVALEVLLADDAEGYGAHFQLLDESRPAVEAALAESESVSADDYYTFTMRYETLELVVSVLLGLETKLGGQPRRFSRDVYRAAAGEVSKGSLS